MSRFTLAFCTYNRAERLPGLVDAIRQQKSPVPFDILAVDNNSTDNTQEVLEKLSLQSGAPLRFVKEQQQGIPYARNRAINESLSSDYLAFIDDDELPVPGLIASAYTALGEKGANCVGGRVVIRFPEPGRPAWLDDELLSFLAAIDYGDDAFWIQDYETPVWTANVAYNMAIFRENPEFRFDIRYNRAGDGIGGGEDAIMFRELIDREYRVLYEPKMMVEHYVDQFKVKRSYFLKLHHLAGFKAGRYQNRSFSKEYFGVPPFMLAQTFRQLILAAKLTLTSKPGALRQGMNVAHSLGVIKGLIGRRFS